jgi:hypothetical protein
MDNKNAWRQLAEKAVEVLQRQIVPNGISDHEALVELHGIFDGPEYRAALAADRRRVAQPAAPVVDGELPLLPDADGSAEVHLEGDVYTHVDAWSEPLVRQAQRDALAAARSAPVGEAVRDDGKSKLVLWREAGTDTLRFKGQVSDNDLAAVRNDTLGRMLLKDCAGCDVSAADHLLALEYIFRNAERAAPSHPEPAGGNAAPPPDDYAAFKAAVDAEYPMPNSPHESVMQRAVDIRTAFRFGWNAGRMYVPCWSAQEVGKSAD